MIPRSISHKIVRSHITKGETVCTDQLKTESGILASEIDPFHLKIFQAKSHVDLIKK